jgi:hypothetical protein
MGGGELELQLLRTSVQKKGQGLGLPIHLTPQTKGGLAQKASTWLKS